MGVDETIKRHGKEWNAFEKGRIKSWDELKAKHNAEATGRGETTPEMQKRFEKEISEYSQEWALKTKRFNERQMIELERELAKENKDKTFEQETKDLNALIKKSVKEQDEIDNQPTPEPQAELSEKEKKRQEYLDKLNKKMEQFKSNHLER